MKLKKAHLVYFVQKDSPKRMDYRFGYNRTPESALKYHLAQWVSPSFYTTKKLVKKIYPKAYDTREEVEAIASKFNEDLLRNCPWEHYEIVK